MPTAIIPIIFTVAIGFALENYRRMEVRALSAIVIYVLLPALIFSSLVTTKLTFGDALPLVGVVVLLTLILWGLGKAVARARRYDQHQESFFLLTTIFMNAGNMGMPVCLYAFGNDGLDLAVIWVLVVNTLSNTIAIYYVSRHLGGGRQAMRTVFTLPTLYAAAAALAMRGVHVGLPTYVLEPVQLLGRAVIPVSQLLLGIQLAKSRAQVGDHLSAALLPGFVRLLLSPAIALGLAMALGVHGLTFKVAILLAAMPTGINMAVYATEFDAQPRLVATAVFASTLASFVTLTGLLVLLR